MLNKDEEYRVLSVIEFVKPVHNHDPLSSVSLTADLVMWLAKKLKEVNEELKLQSDNSDHCLDHCICLVCMK